MSVPKRFFGNSADGNQPGDADMAAFNAFANFSNNNYAEYFAWLEENNLTGGSLSTK